ncbi:hypothetical protein G6F22_021641 [Rhizopus arrhizus]|nr:hypothetical protein G6F22_021641 [Rhizopus arrhizus]
MKPSAPNVIQVLSALMPKAAKRLAANACDAVAADVSPEHMTVKQTMKIGQRGQQGHREGHQERQPGRAADFGSHLSGQRIDACAQDVADDE